MPVEHMTWEVDEAGYEWRTQSSVGVGDAGARGRDEVRVLVSAAPGTTRAFRIYDPMMEPGLWQTFIKIPPTEEGVLSFARRFGYLTRPSTMVTIRLAESDGKSSVPSLVPGVATGSIVDWGETLDSWVSHLEPMRRAASVWELIRRNQLGEIKSRIYRPSPDHKWIVRSHRHVEVDLTTPQIGSEWWEIVPDSEKIRNESPTVQGYIFIQSKINAGLERRVEPRLWWNTVDKQPKLFFSSRDLAGALWLQFAQAVANRTEYRECEYCQGVIALSGRNSTLKQYCSNRCRQAAHRIRKAVASPS